MFQWLTNGRWKRLLTWLVPPDRRTKPVRKPGDDEDARLISFVALLEEPILLEARTIARLAGEAWQADLSADDETGKDGFVVGASPAIIIRFRERMFFVNAFDRPYVEKVDEVASQIADLRLSGLFGRHRAWVSCDATNISPDSTDAEVREAYRLCGWLMARLVDSNTLCLCIPDQQRLYPNSEQLESLLTSDDPFAAITEEGYAPVIGVANDDPRMVAASQEARERWPEFVAAFESRGPEGFSVKAPITAGGNTEFIWLEVSAIENDTIYGALANDPIDLGRLKLGSRVRATVAELNDWIYFDDEQMRGGFTIRVVEQISKEQSQRTESSHPDESNGNC